ncbi:AMP-dependent synthetase [Corallincola luteus]|uniref:AMP-dependent synthetase n=2 Tax=Corallincola luteus TaxID=1775177 RepID=A0ABY2AN38_9GAMM|nr:AMP-dependent synthetase [Corallincola luteus]
MPIDELKHRSEQHPDKIYLRQPDNGQVQDYSWAQVYSTATQLAGALVHQGLKKGDRVAIIGKNCAEWFIADWAIMMAGMISVPIYPTVGRKTLAHILNHSEVKLAFIGKLDNSHALSEVVKNTAFSTLLTVAMPYPTVPCDFSWANFLNVAPPLADLHTPDDDEVMTIIYTSGSTGTPKGVVMSYEAYRYASAQTQLSLGVLDSDRVISYLPLAHITERGVIQGPSLYAGCTVYFVESLATFIDDLNRAQPTFFLSVPRLWNKFLANIHARLSPKKLSFLLSLPIVGNLVAQKIRRTLGLDKVRVFGSGSAPISPEILRWYKKLGMNISEGWGMTETGGLSCCNLPFNELHIGSIGNPIEGTEIKLSKQGEILIRSPGLFQEYYQDPELTEASFTEDGFFCTGDKGTFNSEIGAYQITGRVKELFKTEKGKYVAPVPLESRLGESELLEQICVMGTLMPQPVAVVVLSETSTKMSNSAIELSLSATLEKINQRLEAHEKIAQIFVAKDEWTIENDLLTPTLKIKRADIEERYLPLIANLSEKKVAWEQ